MPTVVNASEACNVAVGVSGRLSQPCWVLDYTLSDGGLCRAGSVRRPWLPRPPRIAHLYPPRFPYWEDRRTARGGVHSTYVTFAGGEAIGLGELVRNRAGFCRIEDPEGLLGERLKRCASIADEEGDAGFLRAEAALLEAIDLVVRSIPTERHTRRICAAPPVRASSPLVETVRAYLKEHLASRPTLDEIATHAHVSVSTLSHGYSEETGETPMQTLGRLRIDVAKNLLMRGHSLAHIAAETGHYDAFHLSKAFKRREGVSPRGFLKQLGRPRR